MKNKLIKGRGAQIAISNPFENLEEIQIFEPEAQDADPIKTQYINTHPKSCVNKVSSPDVPMGYSLNPYQGCEHGCIYCFARNTHTYWGYNAGLEFETKILVKKDIHVLLEKKLRSKNWDGTPIALSGNTDCYQPAEKQFGLTRKCLEVFLKYQHPLSIITKSSLILRDLDLLEKLAKNNLVHVALSITSNNDALRKKLEPRASSIFKRLDLIEKLSERGIPVSVLMAPIIPGLNEDQILNLAKICSEKGAHSFNGMVVRLNGQIGMVFTDWVRKAYPDRADKILNQIKDLHGGTLNDSRWGLRSKGEGAYAKIIAQQLQMAKRKYFVDKPKVVLNRETYLKMKNPQLGLFD